MIQTTFLEAMRSQPEVLRRVEARMSASLASFPAGVVRWKPGDTVAILAMGASHHSAHVLVHELREHGYRAANMVAAELSPSSVAGLADHYLVVTESGRSPEPIAAARHAPTGRRLVITNDPGAAVSEVADSIIDLGGFPDSRAYAAGYTATLLAYAFLSDALGLGAQRVERMSAAVDHALRAFWPSATALGELLAGAGHVDVVGSGISYAAAAETALLIREGLRIPSAAFQTGQYLHGPMEAVGADTVVILFGDGRERTIPRALAATGARCITVGTATRSDPPEFAITARDPFAWAACEAVVAQLLVASAIEYKPFDIETFLRSQADTKV